MIGRFREWLPITNLGLVVLSCASLGYWGLGVPRVDYVVQFVSSLAFALLALAFLSAMVGVYLLRKKLGQLPAAKPILFEAKRGYATILELPKFRWLPTMELSWDWVKPLGFDVSVQAQASGLIEVVEAWERGAFESIRRRFVVEDAFGLVRFVHYHDEARIMKVLPWKGHVENSVMLRAHAGGDELSHPAGEKIGDRIDLRRYQPGDPLKWVLWKVFARTGQMMVRTPERAISPSVRILAFLPSAEKDEPAAAAARVAVSTQILSSDWRFRADGASVTATDTETAVEQIIRSRDARRNDSGDGLGLRPFLDSEADSVGSRVVLFVPAQPGPWLDNCLDVVTELQLPLTAIVCMDGVTEKESSESSARISSWLREEAPEHGEGLSRVTSSDLQVVINRLGEAGADVIALERPSGRVINSSTWQSVHGQQRGAA